MMKRMLLALLLLSVAGCAIGCTAAQDTAPVLSPTATVNARRYALVVKSIDNPYMITMYSGFEEACRALGATPLLHGPAGDGTPSQSELLTQLIDERIDGIAIAANDMDEISPMLRAALQAGIPIVSLDSIVHPQERMVHIQQASPEMIGRVLVQACARIIDGSGQFAILTTTDTMPNQASWVGWMYRELQDRADQYADMTLVRTAYGLDEAEASANETRALLEAFPQLKAIIAPTTVGMCAAAEVIAAAGSNVKLTGLGLPSDMTSYIADGICPWMYLWNPSEVGYLAAYAMDALVDQSLSGAPGEVLAAGKLGDKIVAQSADGGTEIVLGNPIVFDPTNIAVWAELF